jgi:hypothetical protein
MTRHYTKASMEHVRPAMEKMSDGFDVLDRPAKVVEIRKKTA